MLGDPVSRSDLRVPSFLQTDAKRNKSNQNETETTLVLRARTALTSSSHLKHEGMSECTQLGKRAAAEDAEEGDKLYRFAVDWPRKVFPSLSFTVSPEQLKQQDPEGLSVLSGKIGMLGSSGSISGKQIALSPLGPKHK